MQQHVTIGPLRDETGVVGVVVTIEDVTARVEEERRVAEGVSRHVESVTALLGDANVHVRRIAVSTLAHHGAAVVEALVQTLREQHRDLSALSSALDLLSVSDIDIVEPVMRFLEDGDANLRIQAALILGQRRDRRAIGPLMARLGDEDVNVRFHVIEALGRLHAVEASDALTDIALQRDFFLAFPAIQALTEIGSTRTAPRLVPLLADMSDDVKMAVLKTLASVQYEPAREAVLELLTHEETAKRVQTACLNLLASTGWQIQGFREKVEKRLGDGFTLDKAGVVKKRGA